MFGFGCFGGLQQELPGWSFELYSGLLSSVLPLPLQQEIPCSYHQHSQS